MTCMVQYLHFSILEFPLKMVLHIVWKMIERMVCQIQGLTKIRPGLEKWTFTYYCSESFRFFQCAETAQTSFSQLLQKHCKLTQSTNINKHQVSTGYVSCHAFLDSVQK